MRNIQEQKQKEKQHAQARVQDKLNTKLGIELEELRQAEEELTHRALAEQEAKIAAAHRAKQIKAQKGKVNFYFDVLISAQNKLFPEKSSFFLSFTNFGDVKRSFLTTRTMSDESSVMIDSNFIQESIK